MLTTLLAAVAALHGVGLPEPRAVPFAIPPRLLTGYQEAELDKLRARLRTTRDLRERVEQRMGAGGAEWLRREEAVIQRSIDRVLEWQNGPIPWMPVMPPSGTRPKPPRKD